MIDKKQKFKNWQHELSGLMTNTDELASALDIGIGASEILLASQLFKLKIPRQFLSQHQANEAVLKQFVPAAEELLEAIGYVDDPLQELAANPVPGLLHKYRNRVLITLTSACAVHCRYCFRRNFPYAENNPGMGGWDAMFDYIKSCPDIDEVILSGGDPLTMKDEILTAFTTQLQTLQQIKRFRIHTRVPVVLPSRLTSGFYKWIKSLPWPVVMVLHVNHPDEITAEVGKKLKKLRRLSVHLLNQSVLLKDVNDNVDTLVSLSEILFSHGVLPYYLHLLDKVKGAAHFAVEDDVALALYSELSARLSGYLLPKLVREEAGAGSKTQVF